MGGAYNVFNLFQKNNLKMKRNDTILGEFNLMTDTYRHTHMLGLSFKEKFHLINHRMVLD